MSNSKNKGTTSEQKSTKLAELTLSYNKTSPDKPDKAVSESEMTKIVKKLRKSPKIQQNPLHGRTSEFYSVLGADKPKRLRGLKKQPDVAPGSPNAVFIAKKLVKKKEEPEMDYFSWMEKDMEREATSEPSWSETETKFDLDDLIDDF